MPVLDSLSSIVSTKNHNASAPTKIQRLDQDVLRRTFYNFTSSFACEVDLYFKNHNRFIKDSKNRFEAQGKTSKREKLLHAQFINHEEIKLWKEFPRGLKFYHSGLSEIK